MQAEPSSTLELIHQGLLVRSILWSESPCSQCPCQSSCHQIPVDRRWPGVERQEQVHPPTGEGVHARVVLILNSW